MKETKNAITFLRDREWRVIDEEVCRVIEFIPMASIENGIIHDIGGLPFASIKLECKKYPGKIINGFITHKIDFANLWKAFKGRGINSEEEVMIFWSTRHYKNWLYRLFSFAMPKLWIMVCRKGAFELTTDNNFKPEIRGEARWRAKAPLAEWKPEIMN